MDAPHVASAARRALRTTWRREVASARAAHYIVNAELPGASGAKSPGPYRSLRELSLTGLEGSDIWRPPTFRREPGIERSNGRRGSALFCSSFATTTFRPGLSRPRASLGWREASDVAPGASQA